MQNYGQYRFWGWLCLALYYIVLTCLASWIPFFWDNVLLVSKTAQHFYQNGCSPALLPLEIDAGHPPLYGMYMALCWKLFGQTLQVSHWAVLPFLWGIVWAYWGLAKQLGITSALPFAALLLVIEPCLAAQAVLGSSDVALLCLQLLCIYSILSSRFTLLTILLPIMAMLNLRGIILVFALGAAHFYITGNTTQTLKPRLRNLLPAYLPALLSIALWLVYHYQHTGFFTNNTTTASWSGNYGWVSFSGLLRNIAVVVWRMADQGRIILWLALGFTGLKLYRQNFTLPPLAKQFIALLAVQFIIFLPFVVLRQTPIMHRYFMGFYLLTGLLLPLCLQQLKAAKLRRTLMSGVTIALLSGPFWLYPYPIANGWDATLACLPYFNARQEVNSYLSEHQILPAQVSTAFPMIAGTAFTELNSSNRFQLNSKDMLSIAQADYVLYGNISNDFTPAEVAILYTEFTPVQEFGKGTVRLVLYQRN